MRRFCEEAKDERGLTSIAFSGRSRFHRVPDLEPGLPSFQRHGPVACFSPAPSGARLAVAFACACACLGGAARADPAALPIVPALPSGLDDVDSGLRAQAPASEPSAAAPWGVLGGSWQSPTVLGDMGGLRPALARYGITLQA